MCIAGWRIAQAEAILPITESHRMAGATTSAFRGAARGGPAGPRRAAGGRAVAVVAAPAARGGVRAAPPRRRRGAAPPRRRRCSTASASASPFAAGADGANGTNGTAAEAAPPGPPGPPPNGGNRGGGGGGGKEAEVLDQLRRIEDPDLGADIVACGFVKGLVVDGATGEVAFALELTTPACPVKDEFERLAREYVGELPWVTAVRVSMTAEAPAGIDVPNGLRRVGNIIAVSSCKGGVGKSTVSVNLAYSLAMMGAKVGIFDADVYGPSLPTMTSPEVKVLQMDPETKELTPCEYAGVKLVSFGHTSQGSAIMRGPMVSGLINQLLTTAQWGELDYLVVDFPPGTGDIQLTLCQSVPIAAAVIVTTPQKLAYVDVAKGIRMFARLRVPCVAAVENMSYFEVDGVQHRPFGGGSGDRIQREFGVPHLMRLPIVPEVSEAGDGGVPVVVRDPTSDMARVLTEVGAAVVQEVARNSKQQRNRAAYSETYRAIVCDLPEEDAGGEFFLDPAVVRENDTSAKSIEEWTGSAVVDADAFNEQVVPESLGTLGNYAMQISWSDGFNQVAPFEQLAGLPRLDKGELAARALAAADKLKELALDETTT